MTHPKIIVLDDDPTGTQSVHNTTVLLQWDVDAIADRLRGDDRVFYLLTNSRALVEDAAVGLATTVGLQITAAIAETGVTALVVSRSDSTLRGHYPAEVDALAAALGNANMPQLLVPAFLDGGRVTINGEHCIRDADGTLTKVSETEFAQDATFGFSTSFMPAYIAEKTHGRISADGVVSIPAPATRFPALPNGTVAYADASEQEHLDTLAASILTAMNKGQQLLVRSAASLVPCLAGLERGQRWRPDRPQSEVGGLVVVGSYVRKSTEQLAHLQATHTDAVSIDLNVRKILDDGDAFAAEPTVKKLLAAIQAGQLAILSTTRQLVSDQNPTIARSIGQQVARVLNETVRQVVQQVMPAFIIGKGGITSSDLASVSLAAHSARVLGQIAPGVSVWNLDSQPGLPYVVFPGNVGGPDALLEVVQQFSDS